MSTALQVWDFETVAIREAGLQLPVAAAAPVESATHTEAGTVGMVRTRGYKIVDESKIPREYWLLDIGLIRKTYSSGGDVPGCEEDITYSSRTR